MITDSRSKMIVHIVSALLLRARWTADSNHYEDNGTIRWHGPTFEAALHLLIL